MRDIKGSTSEESRMIKAIQRSVGALDNGYIGNQTMSDIAAKLGADCWPLNVELYGQPCILARDIDPVNMSGPLPKNAISGSFSWQGQPCSILVRGGKVVRGMSCHYPTPESVLSQNICRHLTLRNTIHATTLSLKHLPNMWICSRLPESSTRKIFVASFVRKCELALQKQTSPRSLWQTLRH